MTRTGDTATSTTFRRTISKRRGLIPLAIALALMAAACGGDQGDDATGVDTGGDQASATSDDVGSDAGSGSSPGSATIPQAICANGALIDGVVDIAWLQSAGIVDADASALGTPFSAADWATTPYHSCGASTTDGFIDISLNANPTPNASPTETLEIDGQQVLVVIGEGGDRTIAVAQLPVAEGGSGFVELHITAVAYADADLARSRVITIAERVIPAVSVATPTPAATDDETDPAPIPDDPFAAVNAWRVEQIPGWAVDCEGGDLFACDFLWYTAPSDSPEFEIGVSCGGTREATASSRCVPFDDEPITEGDHPLLDELTGSCRAGDLDGCFRLRVLVSGASAYYDFAEGCAAQIDEGEPACTLEMFADGTGR